jgi:hypothetical protein
MIMHIYISVSGEGAQERNILRMTVNCNKGAVSWMISVKEVSLREKTEWKGKSRA